MQCASLFDHVTLVVIMYSLIDKAQAAAGIKGSNRVGTQNASHPAQAQRL